MPASLDELHGPSSGLVSPPRRLWWSGDEDTKFDLGNRSQAAELYEAIFEAARTYDDITGHLDAGLLTELWPELGMRRATRQEYRKEYRPERLVQLVLERDPGLELADFAEAVCRLDRMVDDRFTRLLPRERDVE